MEQEKQGFKYFWNKIGSSFVAAGTVFGPATVLLAALAGARFGYKLTWVLILIAIERILFMDNGNRLGIGLNTYVKKPLLQALGDRYGNAWKYICGILFALAPIIYVSSNTVGSTVALDLVFGDRHRYVLFGIITLVIAIGLFFFKNAYHAVERFSLYAVLLMFAAFFVSIFFTGINVGEFVKGFIPDFSNLPSIFMGLSIYGTTASGQGVNQPYVCMQKGYTEDDFKKDARLDHILSTAILVIITGIIMALSAETIYGTGTVPSSAPEFARILEPIAGPACKVIFGLGLVGAAFSSLVGAPYLAVQNITDAFNIFETGEKTTKTRTMCIVIIAVMGLIGLIPMLSGTAGLNIFFIATWAGALLGPLRGTFVLLLSNRKDVVGNNLPSKGLLITLWVFFIVFTAYSTYTFVASNILGG